jgi:DNA-binding CsgD family transcriptional regulator
MMTVDTTAGPETGAVEGREMCVVYLDRDMRVWGASADLLTRLRMSSVDICRRHLGEFLHPSIRTVVLSQLGRLAEGTRRRVTTQFLGTEQFLRTDSASTWLSGRMTGIAVQGGAGPGCSVVALVHPDRSHAPPTRTAGQRRKLLSELDAKVLEGVAAGCSTVEMANKLFLSRQGVEYHVGAMLRRFKCANRSALVAKTYAQGVLTVGQWPPSVVGEYIR